MKKAISIILTLVMLLGVFSIGVFAGSPSYTIESPYEDVIWDGANAWGAYKGTLHTHTTYSDSDIDLATMMKEYYAEDYDFVANSDHGITGVEWNKEPEIQALYAYQTIIGNKVAHLTDEEFEAITNGTYEGRGKGMTCVVGANELNNLSLTKNHVNGYFLAPDVGNGYSGGENEPGFEAAVKFVDDNGGLSHINHPGDWLDSNSNPEVVNNMSNVKIFGDILLKYDSCLGIEAFNERNGTTGYDRILWDNLLMYCLPYGKNVIGFSNTDAHSIINADSSFSVFMMEENNVDNIKATMQSGAFFGVTRALRGNNFEIGPAEEFDVRGTDIPYPMFTSLKVDGHKITATAENATEIQWIANGNVIMKQAIGSDTVTLDLDSIAGAEDFLYVRAEVKGEGGICISQAFVIENGTEDLTFNAPTISFIQNLINIFKESKLCAILMELFK